MRTPDEMAGNTMCQTAQRAAAAEAENERLREALRATVAAWERHYSKFPLDETVEDDEFGAFQSARAALQEAPRDA